MLIRALALITAMTFVMNLYYEFHFCRDHFFSPSKHLGSFILVCIQQLNHSKSRMNQHKMREEKNIRKKNPRSIFDYFVHFFCRINFLQSFCYYLSNNSQTNGSKINKFVSAAFNHRRNSNTLTWRSRDSLCLGLTIAILFTHLLNLWSHNGWHFTRLK